MRAAAVVGRCRVAPVVGCVRCLDREGAGPLGSGAGDQRHVDRPQRQRGLTQGGVAMEQFTGLVVIQDGAGHDMILLSGDGSKISVGRGPPSPDDPRVPTGAAARTRDDIPLDFSVSRISIDGATGELKVKDGAGRQVLHFNSANAQLFVGAADNEGDVIVQGDVIVRDGTGRDALHLNSDGAELLVGSPAGKRGHLGVFGGGGGEVLSFRGAEGRLIVGTDGKAGDVIVRDRGGNDVIHLNGSSGDIILGNADAAEDFELAATAEATPGAVMVLTGAGTVGPCAAAYDRKVVGVVAGAGSFRPAIVLGRRPGLDERRVPISVMGKAACQADAAYGAIEVGDLLTSSATAGTAMRVADAPRAFGAVIGKALTPLREGTGLVEMVIGLH